MGQGQPRVIIWTNYDGEESPMLHTKFRRKRSTGSGDFWRVFSIYGSGGHLGHVTQMPWTNFRSHFPWRLHTKFGFDWPNGFEEDVDRRTTYKLYYEPKGELTNTKWFLYKSGVLFIRLLANIWIEEFLLQCRQLDRPDIQEEGKPKEETKSARKTGIL